MNTKTIAESNHFIVLNQFTAPPRKNNGYQSEKDLEEELIKNLQAQGYEYRPEINNSTELLKNIRLQLEKLNKVQFLDSEWKRFTEEYLDNNNESLSEKSYKIHHNHICDFVFEDGTQQNIYLLDKKNITNNTVQVVNQFEQNGKHLNRYDVTILVNGLPLVQVELKKRGVAIREAFNQIHRYSNESFNSEHSLFKYLQLFVISNGTDTRYFANTNKRNKNSFDFTANWATNDNLPIKDLTDFTATFFQKNTLLNILINYSVFDIDKTLLIMRPYQIAAAERIIWKIISSYQAKRWSTPEGGGYIWHTTGSGKTLTSFKVAQAASQLDFIDKVFFVVDRKDLDFQTMKEYQRFSPDSVNGSASTQGLIKNIQENSNKIIVTTIQKLNRFMKISRDVDIYDKQVVFIFDECHRSQFGEAQKNLKMRFKKYYQFGFTGTPIFPQNASQAETTSSIFGRELHNYVITDAIRDDKVLKFKVDYHETNVKFKKIEDEKDKKKQKAAENMKELLHPERIEKITKYILENYKQKTIRQQNDKSGFNAMFAVSSIKMAKAYYESFKELQKDAERPLKVAVIYSFAANESQDMEGEIEDEEMEVFSALNLTDKEFLVSAINDYNAHFKTNYTIDNQGFQDYHSNISQRVKSREIDLLIVVGMFLTGFDSPRLNTLFVDKNLKYHGLIQAFSRTNRIYNSTKPFGNIVTFRNLEQETIDALTLFGNKKIENIARFKNIVLVKNYKEYMYGFVDPDTEQANSGLLDVVKKLNALFPDPANIETEKEKKEYIKLFNEYMRADNILQNYDEYANVKAFQKIDRNDESQVAEFIQVNNISEEEFKAMTGIVLPTERALQDYRSAYNDIREEQIRQKQAEDRSKEVIDWSDITFEVDLLKSQEINLDYILGLIFDHYKRLKNKEALIDEVRNLIKSSIGNRAKEEIFVDFINNTDLDKMNNKDSVIDSFLLFAQAEKERELQELITEEKLNPEGMKHLLKISFEHDGVNDKGTDLNNIMPKMSPLNPAYIKTKERIFHKLASFVEKFKDIVKYKDEETI